MYNFYVFNRNRLVSFNKEICNVLILILKFDKINRKRGNLNCILKFLFGFYRL